MLEPLWGCYLRFTNYRNVSESTCPPRIQCPSFSHLSVWFFPFLPLPRASTWTAQARAVPAAPLASSVPPTDPLTIREHFQHSMGVELKPSDTRPRLSFVYIRSFFYDTFFKQPCGMDIVSVGNSEIHHVQFSPYSVHSALSVLRRVNRPLRKVWQTFSALKFARKVGQANSGDWFYDKRRYEDALYGRLGTLWLVCWFVKIIKIQ